MNKVTIEFDADRLLCNFSDTPTTCVLNNGDKLTLVKGQEVTLTQQNNVVSKGELRRFLATMHNKALVNTESYQTLMNQVEDYFIPDEPKWTTHK